MYSSQFSTSSPNLKRKGKISCVNAAVAYAMILLFILENNSLLKIYIWEMIQQHHAISIFRDLETATQTRLSLAVL